MDYKAKTAIRKIANKLHIYKVADYALPLPGGWNIKLKDNGNTATQPAYRPPKVTPTTAVEFDRSWNNTIKQQNANSPNSSTASAKFSTAQPTNAAETRKAAGDPLSTNQINKLSPGFSRYLEDFAQWNQQQNGGKPVRLDQMPYFLERYSEQKYGKPNGEEQARRDDGFGPGKKQCVDGIVKRSGKTRRGVVRSLVEKSAPQGASRDYIDAMTDTEVTRNNR